MYSFPNFEPVCCSISSFNCCFLTCIQVSQEAGQVVWYFHLFKNFPQFVMIQTVQGIGIVNKAEADAFLQLSCFFHDSANVGNLISGPSAFSKFSLNIWKFSVCRLLKPSLENFQHYIASIWKECNRAVVWTFFGTVFGIGIKSYLLQPCGHCRVFQNFWYTEHSTFIASLFRIWNSWAGIPSSPLALFVMMLPKAHLTFAL